MLYVKCFQNVYEYLAFHLRSGFPWALSECMVLDLKGTIILYLLFILYQDKQMELPDPRHPQRVNRPICWAMLGAPPGLALV